MARAMLSKALTVDSPVPGEALHTFYACVFVCNSCASIRVYFLQGMVCIFCRVCVPHVYTCWERVPLPVLNMLCCVHVLFLLAHCFNHLTI